MAEAVRRGLDFTDDCQVFRLSGGVVYLTPGSYANLKITTPEDLPAAEEILAKREGEARDGEKE